ncbi:MAG: glycosyltransferase family 9 protein [Terracidiphilus sp.]|jgi:heptosyltransferase-2
MTHKALIVKIGALGDVASVLPAARKLQQSGLEIDWLCGKTIAPLLACYSWVHPIAVDEELLFGDRKVSALWQIMCAWGALIGSSYDLCAILQYDRRYRILTLPARTRRSIALSSHLRDFKLISERHHSAEYARILCGTPDGYCEENIAPVAPDRLPPNPMQPQGKTRIALAPGGARNTLRDDAQRRWPLNSYYTLAKMLLDKGYEVVLTGGPGDRWVESRFSDLPVENRIAQWPIPQTLAFYQSCDCVITHDTGPLHLAGLVQCGLVGLFGPTAPSKALPRRKGVIGLWGGERLPCRPCYDGRSFATCEWNGCMISIPSQRVAAAVESLLENPGAEWQVICL